MRLVVALDFSMYFVVLYLALQVVNRVIWSATYHSPHLNELFVNDRRRSRLLRDYLR
jgi:hypothetical protein